MRGVNPRITKKIESLIGDDAPAELKEFFQKMLEREVRQENIQWTSTEMARFYTENLVIFAKNKSIIEFIRGSNND